MSLSKVDNVAPDGYVWFCPSCRKTSPTQSGWLENRCVADRGWDVSCFLQATLITLEAAIKYTEIK